MDAFIASTLDWKLGRIYYCHPYQHHHHHHHRQPIITLTTITTSTTIIISGVSWMMRNEAV